MSADNGSGKPAPSGSVEGPSTRAVHAGAADARPGEPVVSPIFQSATFFTDPVPSGEVLYTRYGTNPNHVRLGEKLASLDAAEAALPLASGNAACALAILACVGAGDHIVAPVSLYGGTLRLLTREMPRLGIGVSLVEPGDAWADAMRAETRLILAEVPVNPTLRVPDIRPLAALAKESGSRLVVDATFATPINFRPLEHGADLVIHSGTKYMGGHSDLTAGVVAGRADLVEEVREKLISFGPVLDPHASWLLERGLKTLAVRMARHNENGFAVASWLECNPAVTRVNYPGLASHPDHDLARELFDGFGGMVSIVVNGGDDAALRVMNRLRLLRAAPSLGGVESLASMPRFTSHASLTPDERRKSGIDDGFIRLSLGIEDARDLIADLDQALAPEAG
jgi:cystathionine beta-lyase/cystathionine gamma-synthase